MVEYMLLENLLDEMESSGATAQMVSISIDQSIVDQIKSKHNTRCSLDDLKHAADLCLSREWLKHSYLGAKQYEKLQLTPTGAGVARSKRMAAQAAASRPMMKKMSDYITDHSGLFVFLGCVIGVVTLLLKLFKDTP